MLKKRPFEFPGESRFALSVTQMLTMNVMTSFALHIFG